MPPWRRMAISARALSRAVQDQLGLRLETKKSPLDMLVIDHIESGAERALPILSGIGAGGRVETGKPQVAQ